MLEVQQKLFLKKTRSLNGIITVTPSSVVNLRRINIFFDNDILVANVANNQGSGNLRGMVDCNGLTILPIGVDGKKDDFIDAIWIR